MQELACEMVLLLRLPLPRLRRQQRLLGALLMVAVRAVKRLVWAGGHSPLTVADLRCDRTMACLVWPPVRW